MNSSVLETRPQSAVNDPLQKDVPPSCPSDAPANALQALLALATAGQKSAAVVLRDAIDERRPLILFFGETGVGKSTLIRSVLSTAESDETRTIYLSATDGELIGRPIFDAFLDAVGQQVADGHLGRERPAKLAALASVVASYARIGRTIVLAIDHADHLGDAVISDLIKLPEYLGAASRSFVRIFIGSSGFPSRLDAVVRRPGALDREFAEIRLSQPTIEEVAALLAYEDMAQPGGPMLSAGAIDRISAYAKSNLHWAVPLADAARALALQQGVREVSSELINQALLELWPSAQQVASAADLESPAARQGLSDMDGAAASASAEDLAARNAGGVSSPAASLPGPPDTLYPQRKARGLWVVVGALAFAAALAFFASVDRETLPHQKASVTSEQGSTPEPLSPTQSDTPPPQVDAEEGSGQQHPIEESPSTVRRDVQPIVAPEEERLPERAPRIPANSRQAPSVAKAEPTNSPVAKKTVYRQKATKKKPVESPESQWIQQR